MVPLDLVHYEPRDGGFLLSDFSEIAAEDNSFTAAVELAGKDHDVVLQVLTGTVFICEVPGEGDGLMARIQPQEQPERCAEIAVWSHEERFFDGPVAWDVPTALWMTALYSGESDDVTDRGFEPIRGRFEPRWPFDFMAESVLAGAASGALEAPGLSSNLAPIFDRAWWLARALAGHPIDTRALASQLDKEPAAALGGPWLQRYAPTALYWILRSYLLDEPWLGEVLDAVRDAPSKFVRDAVAAVEADAFAELGVRVREAADQIRNPFPERFGLGPLEFVREDVTRPDAASDPAPLPAPDQAMDPRWGEEATVLDRRGDRMLVAGHRYNPAHERANHLPRHLPALFEVDDEGTVHWFSDQDRAQTAAFCGDFVVGCGDSVVLHSPTGMPLQLLHSSQSTTAFDDSKRWFVRCGGVWNHDVQAVVPRTVELYECVGDVLRCAAVADVALTDAWFDDGAFVMTDGEVGYRATIPATASPEPGLYPTSRLIEAAGPRVGPQAITSQLTFNDWCHESSGGHCFVLKHLSGSEFEVQVGEELKPTTPPLRGTMGYTLVDDEHAAVFFETSVWMVHLPTAEARCVLEDVAGFEMESVHGHGFARAADGVLTTWLPDGDRHVATELPIGGDVKALMHVQGRRFLALASSTSPLIVLGLADDQGWRLIGAVPPKAGIGPQQVKLLQNPHSFYHVFVTAESRHYRLAGLEQALAEASAEPPLSELSNNPWSQRALAIHDA